MAHSARALAAHKTRKSAKPNTNTSVCASTLAITQANTQANTKANTKASSQASSLANTPGTARPTHAGSQILPREKLIQFGVKALSDSELLAILLGTGIPGVKVAELAAQLLEHFGSLGALMRSKQHQFQAVRGVGAARYAQIVASMELCRRTAYESISAADVLSSPGKVREYLSLQLGDLEHEVFSGLFLDNRHRLLEYKELFNGTIDGASVYPREVLKHCLSVNAAAVIFAHNHPSGVAEPSDADINLTRKLADALALIDVRVLDHLIIGRGVQTSLAERGLL